LKSSHFCLPQATRKLFRAPVSSFEEQIWGFVRCCLISKGRNARLIFFLLLIVPRIFRAPPPQSGCSISNRVKGQSFGTQAGLVPFVYVNHCTPLKNPEGFRPPAAKLSLHSLRRSEVHLVPKYNPGRRLSPLFDALLSPGLSFGFHFLPTGRRFASFWTITSLLLSVVWLWIS